VPCSPSVHQSRLRANPFQPGRHAVAYSLLPEQSGAPILDYGCGDGRFIQAIAGGVAGPTYGCDIDAEAVAAAPIGNASTQFFTLPVGTDIALPFPNEFFAAIFMCDVLEHMDGRSGRQVLAELTRILMPGGCLIVTVPHQGLLGWADPENIKFRWPRLHRWLYRYLDGIGPYDRRFGGGGDRVGNFAPGAGWHQHFSVPELRGWLSTSGLQLERTVFFGLMSPLISATLSLLERLQRRYGWNLKGGISVLWKAWIADSTLSIGRLSYCVAVRGVKSPHA
jgi:SAM-dependent methyltransferase